MKLKAITNYTDKKLNMDIKSGTELNELYEAKKVELTEERVNELIAAGVAGFEAPEATETTVDPEATETTVDPETTETTVDSETTETTEVKKNVVEEGKQK